MKGDSPAPPGAGLLLRALKTRDMCHGPMGRSSCGFTLVEVLVVLIVMTFAAALVAPALLRVRHTGESQLAPLVAAARDVSARRAEVVYLRVTQSGEWRLRGDASREQGDLATGRLSGFEGPPLTLVVSPIGTCAFDVRSAAVAGRVTLDPLTCEVRAP